MPWAPSGAVAIKTWRQQPAKPSRPGSGSERRLESNFAVHPPSGSAPGQTINRDTCKPQQGRSYACRHRDSPEVERGWRAAHGSAAAVCSMPRAALQAALCELADAEQADLDGCFTEPKHLTTAQRLSGHHCCHSHQACPNLPL